MKFGSMTLLLTLCLASSVSLAEAPRVFVLDGEALLHVRQAAQQRDPFYVQALEQLEQRAQAALRERPYSVTHKRGMPPSGDKHDYMTIGPYWWPNPDTEDGLPYVRRDGVTNPQANDNTFDRRSRSRMTSAVNTLAQAYFFTGEEAYAEHAALLLRTWFLDEATAMNPHLQYAQAVPGRNEGRGIGIIDTVGWIDLIDSVGLIQSSPHWTAQDHEGLRRWFGEYLDWLKTSDNGRNEQGQINNHGTWYDAQVMIFALFTDQPDLAKEQLRQWTLRRIDSQMTVDGEQPYEVRRTRSWNYSTYNLRAFFTVARLGRHVDENLWQYEDEDGRSLTRALHYLLDYHERIDDWPHRQISSISTTSLGHIILPWAYEHLEEERYLEIWRNLPQESLAAHLTRLTHQHVMRPRD